MLPEVPIEMLLTRSAWLLAPGDGGAGADLGIVTPSFR
ncbi:hypothetical protein NT01EI_3333 [Edwardsiella ictaluri 93-146]|uniref:Uncharacterized protein n=1 Tax=Edwardsiella ictaluri (strain 93-146) TaxID=634503 RepID=C5B943_EDWI9|nr:hypothetical protein NT01EI_3333 [Edwardsiella ictaluri 93-146]